MRKKLSKHRFNFSQNNVSTYLQQLQTFDHSVSNPSLILPKIGHSYYQTPSFENPLDGLTSLQRYIGHQYLKKHEECEQNRRLKKLQSEMNSRKEKESQQQEIAKKESQEKYMNQLRIKLMELQKDLLLEQKKLNLDKSYQRKNKDIYNQAIQKINSHASVDRMIKRNKSNKSLKTQIQEIKQIAPAIKRSSGNKTKVNWLRKFRVAGYVVFFAILFPKYVKTFNKIRNHKFIQNIKGKGKVQSEIQIGKSKLQNMKIQSFWKDLQRENRRDKGSFAYFDFQQNDQYGNQIQFSFRLSNISRFILFMLKNIKIQLMSGEFDSLIRYLSLVMLDRSYLQDRLFLLNQLYRLRINTDEKQLNLEKQHQKILIINFFFAKLIANQFMIKIGQSKDLQSKNQKIKPNKYEQMLMVEKQLMLSGVYLLNLCNKLNIEKDDTKKREGNIEKLLVEDMPTPMKQFQFDKNILIGSNKIDEGGENLVGKRISIEDRVNFDKIKKFGIVVDNMEYLNDIVEEIGNNDSKQDEIIVILRQITDLIHKKCWKERSNHFRQIAEETYKQKYLITKHQPSFNNLKGKPANEVQQTTIYRIMFQQLRNNQFPSKGYLKVPSKRSKLSVQKISNSISHNSKMSLQNILVPNSLKRERLSNKIGSQMNNERGMRSSNENDVMGNNDKKRQSKQNELVSQNSKIKDWDMPISKSSFSKNQEKINKSGKFEKSNLLKIIEQKTN